jgi:ankyrin repeat protein
MVDWVNVLTSTHTGGLYKYIKTIPKENWNDIEPVHGFTLLHYACSRFDNISALKALILNGANVNVKDIYDETPLIWCIRNNNFIGVKMLYKSGADIKARTKTSLSILELSLVRSYESFYGILMIKFFIVNGYRLKNIRPMGNIYSTTEMRNFESGVLKCRRATIAMLHSKRKCLLTGWDKFLLAQLAKDIWATRDDPKWQEL